MNEGVGFIIRATQTTHIIPITTVDSIDLPQPVLTDRDRKKLGHGENTGQKRWHENKFLRQPWHVSLFHSDTNDFFPFILKKARWTSFLGDPDPYKGTANRIGSGIPGARYFFFPRFIYAQKTFKRCNYQWRWFRERGDLWSLVIFKGHETTALSGGRWPLGDLWLSFPPEHHPLRIWPDREPSNISFW